MNNVMTFLPLIMLLGTAHSANLPGFAAAAPPPPPMTWRLPVRLLNGSSVTFETVEREFPATLEDFYKFVEDHKDAAETSTEFDIAFRDTKLPRSTMSLQEAHAKFGLRGTRWVVVAKAPAEVKQGGAGSYTFNLQPHVQAQQSVNVGIELDEATRLPTTTAKEFFEGLLKQLEVKRDSKFTKRHWPHLMFIAASNLKKVAIPSVAVTEGRKRRVPIVIKGNNKAEVTTAEALKELIAILDDQATAKTAEYHLLGLPDKRRDNSGQVATLADTFGEDRAQAFDGFARNILGHDFGGGMQATEVGLSVHQSHHSVIKIPVSETEHIKHLDIRFEKLVQRAKKHHNKCEAYVRVLDENLTPKTTAGNTLSGAAAVAEPFHIVETFVDGFMPEAVWKKVKTRIGGTRISTNWDSSDESSSEEEAEKPKEDEAKAAAERDFVRRFNEQNDQDPATIAHREQERQRKIQLQKRNINKAEAERQRIYAEAGILDQYKPLDESIQESWTGGSVAANPPASVAAAPADSESDSEFDDEDEDAMETDEGKSSGSGSEGKSDSGSEGKSGGEDKSDNYDESEKYNGNCTVFMDEGADSSDERGDAETGTDSTGTARDMKRLAAAEEGAEKPTPVSSGETAEQFQGKAAESRRQEAARREANRGSINGFGGRSSYSSSRRQPASRSGGSNIHGFGSSGATYTAPRNASQTRSFSGSSGALGGSSAAAAATGGPISAEERRRQFLKRFEGKK